jgi:hypothetical protein
MKTLLILFAIANLSWADYREIASNDGKPKADMIQRIEDGAFIPSDPNNRDYQEYVKWLDSGNRPVEIVPSEATAVGEEPSQDLMDAKDTKKSADVRLDALIKVLGL